MTQRKPSSLKLENELKLVMKETMLRYSQACVHLIQQSRVREEQTYATAYLSVFSWIYGICTCMNCCMNILTPPLHSESTS